MVWLSTCPYFVYDHLTHPGLFCTQEIFANVLKAVAVILITVLKLIAMQQLDTTQAVMEIIDDISSDPLNRKVMAAVANHKKQKLSTPNQALSKVEDKRVELLTLATFATLVIVLQCFAVIFLFKNGFPSFWDLKYLTQYI